MLIELLENEISDEMREDISDYLLAIEADKENGTISYDEYKRNRGVKKRAKNLKAK